MEQQNEVRIPGKLDADGVRIHATTMTPTTDERPKVVLAKLQGVVPVVFVPGIMGSNLRLVDGKRGYAFNWEAQGRAESVAAPLLSADLAVVSSRDDSPPAFTSDAQALQLWDALIGSIRPLPGSRDAPPPAPHEPPPPVESFEQREFNRRSMDHFLSTGTWLSEPTKYGDSGPSGQRAFEARSVDQFLATGKRPTSPKDEG